MLKAIDILLGVAVVMLVFSAMVTIITQFVISIWNMKGKHLRTGLADLLEQLSPGLKREFAENIAEKVLSHPLIREGKNKLGSVVQRDELTTLLLDFADGQGTVKIDEAAREALWQALETNGIRNPRQVLDRVRAVALQIELGNPALSNSARHNMALLREANSAFLAKLNGWFDQTVDRVTDRFTLSTQYVTIVAGLAVALVLQLDTITLVNQLAKDPGLREALVQVAGNMTAADAQAQPGGTAGNNTVLSDEQRQAAMTRLEELSLVRFPGTFDAWMNYWRADSMVMQLFGILLTAILLSLGAPFWYSALTNLLRLRGVMAPKEDKERADRQTSQMNAPATGGSGNLG